MNLNSIYAVLIFSLLLISCEKEIELDNDQIKKRLVVNSIFSANDTLQIHLSESGSILQKDIFGSGLPNTDNADAKLLNSDGTLVGSFTHTENGNYYLASPFPQAGNTYKLSVTHPTLDAITSENHIPLPLAISSIDTSRSNNKFNIDVTINDNANEENYYSLLIVNTSISQYEISPGVFEYDTTSYNEWVCTKDINSEGQTDIDGTNCQQELLFSDKSFNGSSYTFELLSDINSYDPINQKTIILRSISADLFKYRITLQRYYENQGNPFGEPVQVHSNVENGFGIFSGYSEHKETIVFE